MVGCADLSKTRRAHEFEKAQAGLAVRSTFKLRVRLWKNLMSRIPDGAVALDIGAEKTAQVGCVPFEFFEIAIHFVASKGHRQHKRCMAKQIVPHIRFISYFIFCSGKNLSDQLFIGRRTCKLADGDFFQVNGRHPVALPMPRRGYKGKQDIFLRQRRGKGTCTHVIANKDDVLYLIRPQRLQNCVQLRIAQDNEDHIVLVFWLQFGHDWNPADRHAG